MNDARLRRLEDKVDLMADKVTRAITLMEASSAKEELRDHDNRLAALEALGNRFYGYLIGSGVAGTVGGAGGTLAIIKLFGH